MNVLINNTTQSLEQMLELLKQKIDETILEDRSIVISMETSLCTCLHKMYVGDYEVNNMQIYLQEDNFELNINLPDISQIEYDDVAEECFMIIHNNGIISLYV